MPISVFALTSMGPALAVGCRSGTQAVYMQGRCSIRGISAAIWLHCCPALHFTNFIEDLYGAGLH